MGNKAQGLWQIERCTVAGSFFRRGRWLGYRGGFRCDLLSPIEQAAEYLFKHCLLADINS